MKRIHFAAAVVYGLVALSFSQVAKGQEILFPSPVAVTGNDIRNVAVGDFNRDGKPDLAVANSLSNTIGVALGAGNMAFAPPVEYPTGMLPQSLVAADFNGDGKLDLASVNYVQYYTLTPGSISVLLGNGDGTFAAKRDYPADINPTTIAAGDLNGDGKPDLAVIGSDSQINSSLVSVYINNGDGTFADRANSLIGEPAGVVLLKDFNNDAKLDIVISGTNFFSVLLGNGNGTFAPKRDTPLDYLTNTVAAADFNGDGRLDLVAANYQRSTVSVLLGNGNGTFAARVDYPVALQPNNVATADVNRDGKPDILTTNGKVSVLLNNGDGTFRLGQTVVVGTYFTRLAFGDFNSDGAVDLVTVNYNRGSRNLVNIAVGNGDGTFVARLDSDAGLRPGSASLGDLNNDGKPDFVLANPYVPEQNSGGISVLLGNGDGTFRRTYGAGLVTSLTLADMNGDGSLDIVAVLYRNTFGSITSKMSIRFNNGNGGFGGEVNYTTGTQPQSLSVRDINGDGKPDVVTYNLSSVSVFLNNSSGSMGARTDYPLGSFPPPPPAPVVYDFNGDGIADQAVLSTLHNMVSVALGNGDGTYGAARDYAVGVGPGSLAIADFNGDGKPDLATSNLYSNSISVLLNISRFAAMAQVSGTVDLQGIDAFAPSQALTFTARAAGLPEIVKTLSVAPDSAFALSLPKRNGTLTISGNKYLSKTINLDTRSGDVSGVTATLRAGDANNDNAVDTADLTVLIAAYNQPSTSIGYSEAADFNFDGANDIADLLLLVRNYNQIGD